MKRLARAALAALLAPAAVLPAGAQARQAAGVPVVDNTRPAWTAAAALRLSPTPALVIGDRGGARYDLSRVAGAARLADGRIVIADGGSLELRFYGPTGDFVVARGGRGEGPGEFTRMQTLSRLAGDTLVVASGPAEVSVFTGTGEFVRRNSIPFRGGQAGISLFLAHLGGGATGMGTMRQPPRQAPANRWVDSIPLAVIGPDNAVRSPLGTLPSMEMAADEDDGPRPPWLGAQLAFASDGRSFFAGFPSEYAIRVYSPAGRLQRIIRRSWRPVPVTRQTIDRFVEEWGERWIRTTGPEAENQRRSLRADPYATHLPAFSQLMVDRAGRLWVRAAHAEDAARAGQWGMSPLVPSLWSVFDPAGRWLGDVTMPAHFLPKEIGSDYVLGVAMDDLDVQTVVMYRLGTAAQLR